MDKLLTYIIPIYNMEKYLNRCLETITSSKYLDKLEIICIDDLSTDNSAQIIKKYEKKFPKSIKVILKDQNGHHGSCVNAGIKQASGKYSCILDSDDWVDTNQLDKLIELMELNLHINVFSCFANYVYMNEDKVDKIEKIKTNPYIPRIHNDFCLTKFFKNYELPENTPYDDEYYDAIIWKYVKNNQDKFLDCDLTVTQYWIGREGQSVSNQNFYKYFEIMIPITSKIYFDLGKDYLEDKFCKLGYVYDLVFLFKVNGLNFYKNHSYKSVKDDFIKLGWSNLANDTKIIESSLYIFNTINKNINILSKLKDNLFYLKNKKTINAKFNKEKNTTIK